MEQNQKPRVPFQLMMKTSIKGARRENHPYIQIASTSNKQVNLKLALSFPHSKGSRQNPRLETYSSFGSREEESLDVQAAAGSTGLGYQIKEDIQSFNRDFEIATGQQSRKRASRPEMVKMGRSTDGNVKQKIVLNLANLKGSQ